MGYELMIMCGEIKCIESHPIFWTFDWASIYIVGLRVCLFGDEIGWTKNFGEEMGMKTFFVGVWLEGGEGKKLVGPRCFLPGLLKCFLSKIERKLSERNLIGK